VAIPDRPDTPDTPLLVRADPRARARATASPSSAAPFAGTANAASPSNASLSDNGNGYRSHAWAAACAQVGVARRYTRPRRPQTNGKAEALVKILLREWAYRFAYPTSSHRARALPGYLRWYNQHRPHSSLGGPRLTGLWVPHLVRRCQPKRGNLTVPTR
jgi:transposase InsO family protein